LFAQGRTQDEVARELDVSRQSASRWHAGWHAAGATALQSRGRPAGVPRSPYAGQRVVLRWDGLSAHWSYKIRGHLDTQRDWLTVERLPAYAPELNLVQYLWANLKGAELANFADDTIAEVANQAQHGIQRVCASESPVVGFLAHTGLSPDDEPSP
jgi:hypothetical protein